MHYLFVDAAVACQWCREPMMQVVEDVPEKIIIKLCPVCDRWPPGLLQETENE